MTFNDKCKILYNLLYITPNNNAKTKKVYSNINIMKIYQIIIHY